MGNPMCGLDRSIQVHTPATGWFEIKEIKTKTADVVANEVELTQLTRYPWPEKVIMDRGKEFLAEFADMIEKDYGIKLKRITARNPQANAIIESNDDYQLSIRLVTIRYINLLD